MLQPLKTRMAKAEKQQGDWSGLSWPARISLRCGKLVREPGETSHEHAMHMGMMQQTLSPGVKNSQKPDLGAEMFGNGGDLE